MRSLLIVVALSIAAYEASAFSLSMKTEGVSTRRGFISTAGSAAVAVAIGTSNSAPANAAPEIYNTPAGIKYAILKQPKDVKKAVAPQQGDIVAVEYTGYLTDGKIFDSTHAEGKNNALLFNLGSKNVIAGLNDMVSQMVVGQKVQAIVPPSLAFGDKGLCLDDGECLIKPGSTLVYDVYLKKSSIPPP
jgi:FKBP-type peptidyl-prolyl cis-trans isomerase